MDESLVSRRPRRSTAGNRMEAALAEMADELPKDAEDDKDFHVDKFEEDIAPSDFESTDEEAEQQEAEQQVQNEERQARKAVKSRLEKVTAAAHARQKATFNPEAESSTPRPQKLRRVILGLGEKPTREPNEPGNRKSKRTHTILSTSLHVKRMKRSEEQKSAKVPKRPSASQRILNQDELIARALDNEEGNLIEHRDYLKIEEEKRRRARVERVNLQGGLVRWISRSEEVEVTPSTAPYPFTYPYGSYATSYPASLFTYSSPAASASAGSSNPYMSFLTNSFTAQKHKERVAKNYLIHELGQTEGVPKPTWGQTMQALFGDDVNWDDMKVYAAKGRPLSRPKTTCPITGQAARYLDPRTGVPYANIAAFETLTSLLNHEYVWSKDLGCYVRKVEATQQSDEIGTS